MAAPPLTIRLFGPLRVTVCGAPLPRVRTRSVEWLLALLALRHGRAMSRAWLAGTLWPDSTESRALQNLREDLVRPRRALGPEAERIQSPPGTSSRSISVAPRWTCSASIGAFRQRMKSHYARQWRSTRGRYWRAAPRSGCWSMRWPRVCATGTCSEARAATPARQGASQGAPLAASKRCLLGLKLAAALAQFWFVRGFIREGKERLATAMALAAGAPDPTAVDLTSAPLSRIDPALWVQALDGDGQLALEQSDFGVARIFHQQKLALQERHGDAHGVLEALLHLGQVAQLEGDLVAARTFFERGLALAQQLGDRWSLTQSLNALGVVAELEGDCPRARSFFERSVPLAREVGDRGTVAWGLHALGFVTWQQGDLVAGRARLEESLALFQAMGHRYWLARSLERLAGLALAQQQNERAARLYGAAASLRETIGAPLGPLGQGELDRDLGCVRATLGEAAFARLWAEGRVLTLAEAPRRSLVRWLYFTREPYLSCHRDGRKTVPGRRITSETARRRERPWPPPGKVARRHR